MAREPEHRKLNIPEFKKGESTWWVQGKDTKSTSSRRKAAKLRFYWVIFISLMLTIFGGAVFLAIGYWIYAAFGPKECDLFTPKAEIVKTFKTEHEGTIQKLSYSPEGLFLISASDDSSALLMNAETGEVLRQMKGHQQGITSMAVISLLSQSRMEDARNDPQLALSALRILTGSKDTRAILWNPELNPPIQQRLGDEDNALKEIDNIFEIPPGHTKAITSVALSSDGRYALTGGMDNRFFLWDTLNRSLVKKDSDNVEEFGLGTDLALPHTGPVTALAFNPDGNSYVSGSEDCLIKIWDSNSDDLNQTFSGHNSAVTLLQFGNAGKTLLSASRDQRILLWDLITGKRKQIFSSENEVESAILSPNEKYVIGTMFENSAVLWDVQSGDKLLQFVAPGQITALALSPMTTEDGIPLYLAAATSEGIIVIFSTESKLETIRSKLN